METLLEFLENACDGKLLEQLYDFWIEIASIAAVVDIIYIASRAFYVISNINELENKDSKPVVKKPSFWVSCILLIITVIIVFIVVYIGFSYTKVPIVRTKTLSDAEQELTNNSLSYDLQIGNANYTNKSDEKYKLIIVDQEYETGSVVRKGTQVTLYCEGERDSSNGFVRIDTDKVLADYIGQPVTVSFDILTENDLILQYNHYQDSGVSIARKDDLVIHGSGAYQRVSFTTTVKNWGVQEGKTKGAIGLHSRSKIEGQPDDLPRPNYTIRRVKIEFGTE